MSVVPLTAEEFGRRPEPIDGSDEELVRGVIVTTPTPTARHGIVHAELASRIAEHVEDRRLGWAVIRSGVILERNPDTVRGPDVSFFRIERQPTLPDDYFEIPPDLAVEVLDVDDRRRTVREKIREYITAGTRLAWLVDPEVRTVTVYAGSPRGAEYDESDTLDGGDVLPGFTCRVADLFPPPAPEAPA